MRGLGRSWRFLLLLSASLAVVLVLMAPLGDRAAANPDVVNAGHDLLETDASDTYQNLNLPADFFGPGCDPFAGQVFLEGVPFDSYGGFNGLTPTDTIVERKQDAGPIFPDTIDIEIVRLELKSVQPLTVTGCGGGPQQWEMTAQVPEVGGPVQVPGTMTMRHEWADGGTFDSDLPVIPLITFTQVGGPGVIGPFTGTQIDFAANDAPWCHTANPLDSPPGHVVVEVGGLTSNFFPGIDCSGALRLKVLVGEGALGANHSVRPAEIAPAVGGIAELPLRGAEAAADGASVASEGSGLSTGTWAGVATAAAALVIVLAAGGLYARRRWQR